MADDYFDDGRSRQPNRREFIRRGAILLGVGAWAVPLVQVVRQHGHHGEDDGTTAPSVIDVQQAPGECTTCDPCGLGGPEICGESGGLLCFCAPSASPYPMAGCVCALEVFCAEATPCSAGCPEGSACVECGCEEPVCAPPCPPPEPAPIIAQEGFQVQASQTDGLAGRGATVLRRGF